jgi:hypothetical protein
MKSKLNNWELLEKFFVKFEIPISREVMNGVIHNKPGAGIQLVEEMYTILTQKT